MVAQRDEHGRFVKGESGNPSGRPPLEFNVTELIDAAVTRADWVAIIEKLSTKAKVGDLKAIEMLMDRRFGKAAQPVDHQGVINFIWSPRSTSSGNS
jgi:hypothetical protein